MDLVDEKQLVENWLLIEPYLMLVKVLKMKVVVDEMVMMMLLELVMMLIEELISVMVELEHQDV
jgi:hypothetical protein